MASLFTFVRADMNYTTRLFCAGLLACVLSACGKSEQAPQEQAKQATVAPAEYASTVQQLYMAYFGRPADAGGLANFEARLSKIGAPIDIQAIDAAYNRDAGIRQLVDSFSISDEAKALYPQDTTAFVKAIYANVLNRAPDEEGLKFWVGAIDSQHQQRNNAALAIMAAALANKSPAGAVDAGIINKKTSIANSFTKTIPAETYRGDKAAALARNMLSAVNKDTDVNAFQGTINSTIEAIAKAQ